MKSDPGSSPARTTGSGWVAPGLLLVGVGGWSAISGAFVWGQGHAERPILVFLGLYGIAWLGFLIATTGPPRSIGLILIVAAAARFLLLPSALIQESDVYRYVLDGQVLRSGSNPYLLSPTELFQSDSHPIASQLFRMDARQVAERVSYPEVPTVYPPTAQLSFLAGTLVTGWDWWGQRLVFVTFDILNIGLILLLLRRLEIPRHPVLLYAWNPLVLKEITNSVHLDVLVAFFLLLMLLVLSSRRRLGVAIGSGVALGGAILGKLYPAILLPAVAVHFWRAVGPRRAVVFCFAVGATVLLAWTPFLDIGIDALTRGLRIYSGQWLMNQGAFELLDLAPAGGRVWVAVVVSGIALGLPLLCRSSELPGLIQQMAWLLLLWFLLIPTPFPWYAVPLLALCPFVPDSVPARVGVVLSGIVGLYYLSFYFEYHDFPGDFWKAIRILEHAVLWASIGTFWWLAGVRRHGGPPIGKLS